jgi:hypothetical protein
MTEIKQTAPDARPNPGDPQMLLPPPVARKPGSGREVLLHWVLSVSVFAAMLLIGWLFTK